MPKRAFYSFLKLTYSPISTFDFSLLKEESFFRILLEQSNLYAICQRPVLYFDNVIFESTSGNILFDIKQKNNSNVLKCVLPLFQENITTDITQEISGSFGRHDKSLKSTKQPIRNVDAFHLLQGEKHLIWFTPEKFLKNTWSKSITAEIDGDKRAFTNYTVLYVGKAVKQHVLKRLESHSTLLNILMKESPLINCNTTSHEIVLLFFQYYDNILSSTFSPEVNSQEIAKALQGDGFPNKTDVDNDVEKALINALDPKYNIIKFKNYPKSNDGLHHYKYDNIIYSLSDPITLVYKNGNIDGATYFVNGDYIVIKNDNTVEVLKQK